MALGTTIPAWSQAGNIHISSGVFAGSDYSLGSNYYYGGGTYRYIGAAKVARYSYYDGKHALTSAPVGVAGGAITFTTVLAVEKDMTLALQGASSFAGTGISFPATQSASSDPNTLDDYEEGTWISTYFTGVDGAGTALGSGSVGKYIKIGKLVMLQFYRGATGGATKCLSIGNLPFTPSDDSVSGITSDGTALYSNGGAYINYRSIGEPSYSRGYITFYTNS
jgi:hypothetical protein